MVAQTNDLLSAASAIKLVREHPEAFARLAEPGSLVDVAREVLKIDKSGLAYLSAMPSAVQESLRAAIYDALSERKDKQAKPVQLSYMPSYEFGVQVVDYGQAVSIQVSGPYSAASPGEKDSSVKGRGARAHTSKSARRKTSVRKTGSKRPRRPGR